MTDCIDSHDTPVAADVGQLCAEHFSQLRCRLLELPAVATWLEVNLAAGRAGLAERVTGSSDDPIPLRTDVLDLVGPSSRQYVEPDLARPLPRFVVWEDGDVLAECATWTQAATVVRDAMVDADVPAELVEAVMVRHSKWRDGDEHALTVDRDDAQEVLDRWQIRPTERGGWDQQGADAVVASLRHWCGVCVDGNRKFEWRDWAERNTISGLVGWLSARLSWIAGQDWAAEFASELRHMGSSAHRLVPWREEIRRDPDPCPRCKKRTVVLHIAQGVSRCERKAGGCGKAQPLSDYVLASILPKTRQAG